MSPELFAGVFILVVFSGVFIVYMGLRQRSQQLEMQHRERMAMIERGLTPTAEQIYGHGHRGPRGPVASRSMSLGIVIVAFGLALMSIISIAAESPEVGVGLGGAVAIVGAAFVVNSLIARSQTQGPQLPPPPPGDAA